MISVYAPCPTCGGYGHMPADPWITCLACGQLGRVWAPGAPRYGRDVTLADRYPGEIVTLGTGERAKILWHIPRKTKKERPETTFLGMIEDITDIEGHRPIAFPSCVGVASVDFSRVKVDEDAHANEKTVDYNDPIQARMTGRLL